MPQVTSTELKREFSRFRTIAQREPVMVTRYGRVDLAMLSVREYQRLKQRDRQVILVSELSEAELALLDAGQIPPEAHDFDHEAKG